MLEADQGIITFFNAQTSDDFYLAMSGKLYNGRAFRSQDYPYTIFWQYSPAQPEYFLDGGADQLERLFYQFDIWDRDPSPLNVLTYAKYCMALFDDAAITVTGYSLKRFERTENILLQPEEGEGGDDEEVIQHYYIAYEMALQKN